MIKKLLPLKALCGLFLIIGPCMTAQNALSLDGANDYVQTSYDGVLANGARTVEAWIKTSANSTTTQNVLVDWGTLTPNGSRFTLNLLNNVLRIEIGGSGINGTTILNDGLWHHVAVTYDPVAATKVKLYVDGIQNASGNFTLTPNTSTTTNVRIGRRVDDINHFNGTIDEVRIWNTVRTASEISTNMNTEFCAIPAGLQAYYKLNEGTAGGTNTGISITDDSAGNNNGALSGFALTGTTSNWVTGKTLTVTTGINTAVTLNETTLTAAQEGAAYQWLDCNDGNAEIAGADDASFTPEVTGNYAVEITMNGCSVISECQEVTVCNVDNSLSFNVETHTLTANQDDAEYQWIDCGNGNTEIEGANDISFTPEVTGQYAVVITMGSCEATSGCETVTVCNIDSSLSFNAEINTLTANQDDAEYQWIDCGNGNTEIEGATNASFTPEVTGQYAVVITMGSCEATSGCETVTVCNLDSSLSFIAETNTLTANQDDAEYQWIDCGNGNTEIEGAINASFTPEVTGQYAVVITMGSCEATSGCETVTVCNIDSSLSFNTETHTLTANQDDAEYQWIDCGNGNTEIEGATYASFTPEMTGQYAVVITMGSCEATSGCENIEVLASVDFDFMKKPHIYPNPATNILNISNPENITIDELRITDITGKTVMQQTGNTSQINVQNLSSGMYFLNITSGAEQYQHKFIKQ